MEQNKQKNILEIKRYPDSILRKKSLSISEIMLKDVELLEDMLLTMYTLNGIGLAAPQVGCSVQIIVADVGEGPIKLINPRIVKAKGEDKLTEGCLSVPDINVDVKRPYEIIIEALNGKGEPVEIKADGLLARVIQHEIDHLKGRLIVDYMGMIDKMKLMKLNKNRRQS
ncbi:MAG: peptide deformylase [Candidatus Omnitrophica bacterium]|nr:peptide deformylase [Candidatus Omnitrophota bacterium]